MNSRSLVMKDYGESANLVEKGRDREVRNKVEEGKKGHHPRARRVLQTIYCSLAKMAEYLFAVPSHFGIRDVRAIRLLTSQYWTLVA